jgi:hypothetical protein
MNSRTCVQPAGQLRCLNKSTQIQYVGMDVSGETVGAAGAARQILPPSVPLWRRFLPDDASPKMSGT